MRCIAGIDPGASGAVAVLCGAGSSLRLFLFDMPVHRIRVGKSVRSRVDQESAIILMSAVKAMGVSLVMIEDVGGISGQSASAAFAFGKSCGCIETATVAAKLPWEPVDPKVWIAKLRVPKGKTYKERKQAARLTASRAFPQHAHEWGNQDAGRAEAALIALYGARFVQSWA